MGFWGKSFSFDGIPCEDFRLMMYEMNDAMHSGTVFAGTKTIVEESLPSRWRPIHIGVKQDKRLEFEIVFGVDQERIDANRHMDRYEMEAIAAWLTGHDQYKILEIEQDDMRSFRYKCMITELSAIEYGIVPWAMKAKVTCDGPYAYMYPHVFEYKLNRDLRDVLFNESSINGYYQPLIRYYPRSGNDTLYISNKTDGGREFILDLMPVSLPGSGDPSVAGTSWLMVDNENGVITNSAGLNLYPQFNYNFFRLKRGYNELEMYGDGTLQIVCEFPINVGG